MEPVVDAEQSTGAKSRKSSSSFMVRLTSTEEVCHDWTDCFCKVHVKRVGCHCFWEAELVVTVIIY